MSTRNIAIILAITCVALGIMCVREERKATKLNDALYLANCTVDNVNQKNYALETELEKTKRELEEIKRKLRDAESHRDSLEQDFADYRNDAETYRDEAENYISQLEIDRIYRTPYYYR
jgi:hypothetical protein